MNRRTFLGLGAAGAAVLALGGVGVGLMPSRLREPSVPLRVLDARSFSVLAALADRVCPSGDGFPTPAEVQVAESVDALLATCHPGMVDEVVQALTIFENALAGLVFDGRPTPFTAADPATQDAILEAWRTSSLGLRRQVFKALRGLVIAAYFGHPDTYAAVGYPGPPDFSKVLAAREATDTAEPSGVEEAAP